MELSEEKIVSAFAKVITKNRDADPISLAERLCERLTYLMEDADGGSHIRPIEVTRDEQRTSVSEHPEPKTRSIRPTAKAAAPPVPASSLVTEFNPDEYEQAVQEADPRLRGAALPKKPARNTRVASLSQAQSSTGGVEYWTVETLIAALKENTPEEFYFVPNGCDESVRVLAKRNIQPIIMTQGPSIVRLEYANPGVSNDRSTTDTQGQLDEVVLGLIASKTFTLDSGNLNIESVMDDLEAQMKGLYAPRASMSEPTGRDPGPIEAMFNINDPRRRTPMGDSFEIHGSAGWRNVGDPGRAVMKNVMDTNKRYGNR